MVRIRAQAVRAFGEVSEALNTIDVACPFAFEVDDIHAARAELLSRGVEPVTDIEGGPADRQYWAYFRDSEQNLFEIVQRLV